MGTFMETCRTLLRKSLILVVIGFGLISIVGTGSEDDDNGTSLSNTAPVAQIDSPTDAMVYDVTDSVTFTGSATDAEDRMLTGSALTWDSSKDGRIGSGSSFTSNGLSKGTHTITLTAMDSQGWADSTSVSITMNPIGNTPPTASITNPATNTIFDFGNFITFTGQGYDAEDGWLIGPSLVWYSSKDGQIGTGVTVDTHTLSSGNHTITLRATDSEGTSGTASIALVIKNTQPIAAIHTPADGSTYTLGEAITFNGSGLDDEDGNLTGSSLVWRASNYGKIGEGTSITIDYLPEGTDIIINLEVEDDGGLVDSDSITITITP